MGLRDQFNRITGKTRYVVSRIFIHLRGPDIPPLLGVLNQAGRAAMEADGDLTVMGEGLVDICQHLLQLNASWEAAANEGEVFWAEGDAGDYVNELFTDSAQRYLADVPSGTETPTDDWLTIPLTPNLVVMLTVAFTGEVPDLETNLAEREALEYGLKALINLHYQQKLEAIQVHFSPAQLGDELSDEQVLLNFPELVPL
ncbi:DUF1517 domain-containing protein [Synechocystis sp. LKSZ1]|uniref:DUF1517 domain-containing protein n=1 Tax=Synechocystis sp. LKSZ1 TaxID=3144951 RepID=UPI00336BB3FE